MIFGEGGKVLVLKTGFKRLCGCNLIAGLAGSIFIL